ncbi:MAG: glycosyl hydrolase [Firmicutes bacterium]|nr:glycosyl hydrolase [Bacillota bacterium]
MSRDINEIIKEMTLEEKAELCSGEGWWYTKALERLDIPAIMMTDGPHGLRKQSKGSDHLGLSNSVEAICFPTEAALASSWDRELIEKVGIALGEECQAEGVSILLGPGANIKRSPLCGRNFEYLSEDPYLTSEMAASYIEGVQNQGVGTSLKHYAVNNQEHRRMSTSAEVDERTLREIYLSAFETAVKESQPWSVMCAYNRVNGEYCSENEYLLTDILKDEWGHQGFVVSDWGAVNDRAAGIAAGMELEMPSSHGEGTKRIIEAIENGELSEDKLDQAVARILKVHFKAVENNIENASYDKDAHHALARSVAAQCMVLLKNEDEILPLEKEGKIAILGSFAKNPRYQGGGSSHINPTKIDTAYQEIESIVGNSAELKYAEGYSIEKDEINQELLTEAIDRAKESDVTVIFAGLPDRYESEGYDRTTLVIPPNQRYLIEKISEVQENVIVVLNNGSPVEMPWVNKVKGIIEGYLGGQASGGAIADLLFGNINPSGKLAETFPVRLSDNPSYLNFPGEGDKVEYREGIFVGYRYYDTKKVEPLFPFGYGLSYTDFEYSQLTIEQKEITDQGEVTVSLKVKNIGSRKGKEIVQLYVRDPESTVVKADKELRGFAKVELESGEEKTVTFTLDKRSFAYYNTEIKDWYVESGEYEILLASSSRDIRLKGKINVESTINLNKEVTINTNVGDLMEAPAKKKVLDQLLNKFMENSKLAADLEDGNKDIILAMMKYMPLRNLALFSEGVISREEVEVIVDDLNKTN